MNMGRYDIPCVDRHDLQIIIHKFGAKSYSILRLEFSSALYAYLIRVYPAFDISFVANLS